MKTRKTGWRNSFHFRIEEDCYIQKKQFLEIVVSILHFLDSIKSYVTRMKSVSSKLVSLLTSKVSDSGRVFCGCRDVDHTVAIQQLTLSHLIKVYFQNFSSTLTDFEDTPNCQNKPLCRKTLKL